MRKQLTLFDQNRIFPQLRKAVREYSGIVAHEIPGLTLDIAAAAYRSLLQDMVAKEFWIESHAPHNSDSAVAFDEFNRVWTVNYRRVTAAVDTANLQYAIHWAS